MEIKKIARRMLVLAIVMILCMATGITAYGAAETVTNTETIILTVDEANHAKKSGNIGEATTSSAVKNYGNNTTESYMQMELDELKTFINSHPGSVIKEAKLHFDAKGYGTATSSRRLQLHKVKTESDVLCSGNLISWKYRPQLGANIGSYACVNKDNVRTFNWDVLAYLKERVESTNNTITFGFGLTQSDNNKQVNILNLNNSSKTYLKVVVEYKEAFERVLERIEITTPPTDAEYVEGEIFDPAGMVVTAIYNDGTTEVVTDYEVTSEPLTTSDEQVAITYQDKTAYQPITVKETVIAWEPNIRFEGEYLVFDAYEYDGQYVEDYAFLFFEEDEATVASEGDKLMPVIAGHASYDPQNVGIVKLHLGQVLQDGLSSDEIHSVAIMAVDFEGQIPAEMVFGDLFDVMVGGTIEELNLTVDYQQTGIVCHAELIQNGNDVELVVTREDGKEFAENETIRVLRLHYGEHDVDGDGGYVYTDGVATAYETDIYLTALISDTEEWTALVDGNQVTIKLSENEAAWIIENKSDLMIGYVNIQLAIAGYYGLGDSAVTLGTITVENIDSKTAVCTMTNMTSETGWILVHRNFFYS